MQWEGAAKRSEGSRAWGCKHCRGREEGIWRNRSQCWVVTEYVTASANRSPPFPANEMSPLERSTTSAWCGETLRLLVLLRALIFSPLCDVKSLNLKQMYCWDNLHYSEDSTVSGKYCSKSPQGVFGHRRFPFVPVMHSLCHLYGISNDRVDITPRRAPTKRN